MKKQNNEHYDIHVIIWLLMALPGWWGCCSSGWCEHFQGVPSFGWPESNLINVNLDFCFGTLPSYQLLRHDRHLDAWTPKTPPFPTPIPITHWHSKQTILPRHSVFSWLEKSGRFTVPGGFGNLANSTCQPPGAFSPPWSCPPSCQPWCSSP